MIWFNTILLAALLLGGLFYGFTGLFPRFYSRLFRGVMIFSLGAFAPLIPPQFVLSAILVGAGVRMMWSEACKRKTYGREDAGEPGDRERAEGIVAVFSPGTEIVAAEHPERQVSTVPSGNHREFQHVRGESAD